MGFPGGTIVQNLTASAGDARNAGSIPGLRKSPGVGNGNPLQYSCLENSEDRGAWRAAVQGAAKSWTWLSKWVCTHTHTHTDMFKCSTKKHPSPPKSAASLSGRMMESCLLATESKEQGRCALCVQDEELREPHFSAQRTLGYYKVKAAWVGWSVENLNLVVVDLTRRWNSFIFLGLRTFSSCSVRCQKNSENGTDVTISLLALIQLCKISTLEGKGNTTGNSQHYFYHFLRVYIMI